MLSRFTSSQPPSTDATTDPQPPRPSPEQPPRPSPEQPPRPSPALVLTEVFGYADFRPGQKELIDAVLAGRDAVGIMPTGAGKSLTFQIPARVLGGVTLVISPLIALMKDQVDAMTKAGLRATFLNSSLSGEEKRDRIARILRGEVELVYAAPEGLQASVGTALSGVRLSLIAVDEAHCISSWGHDFRPAYRELWGMKRQFGASPVLALTATATQQVTRDIIEQLGMRSPTVFRSSFFRPNLRIAAHPKSTQSGSTTKDILRIVQSHPGQSGIVYCLSRKSTETTARLFIQNGCRAAAYHAGMDPDERERVQEAFCHDELDVIVATLAFGMGINKPDIRFVVHRDLPRSLEGYYQEIGRAGRDGLPSDCILFYSWNEVAIYEGFAADAPDEVAGRMVGQARNMFRFADTKGCRHQRIGAHFGEFIRPCGTACDHCSPTAPFAVHPRKLAPAQRAARARAARSVVVPSSGPVAVLFEQLRVVRRRLADERGVNAFVVASDATLRAMAATRPTTPEQLLRISGIGPHKLANYGGAFLAVLRRPPG